MANLTNIKNARLGDHLDHDLMFTFVAAFSRFEYALKSTGFRTSRRDTAEPDWDRFAQKIAKAFAEHVATDPDCAFR